PGTSQAFAIAERLGLPPAIVAEARSRLTESQQAFEETLASIKAERLEMAETLARARVAETRTAEERRAAEEERRRARRERDEAVTSARAEAERLVDELRDEIRAARRGIERETITARSLDLATARVDERLQRLPAPAAAQPRPAAVPPQDWRVGARARSRSQGWEGRIAALDRGGRRATLEAGGMRVMVSLDDLEAAVGNAGVGPAATSAPRPEPRSGRRGSEDVVAGSPRVGGTASALRLERARTVASSLDLRGAKVAEALELLDRYVDDATLAGLDQVTIIHGLGTGALRDAVREHAGGQPLVRSWRAGGRGEGGDGATVLSL
ncbi:MAG: Smr/MutS family protein, partial [Candidatus Limnocylindrales bacterium]